MEVVQKANLDQVDLVPTGRKSINTLFCAKYYTKRNSLSAKSLNELDVLSLSAALVQNAKMRLTLVKSLSAFTESTRKTIMDHGLLEDVLY